MSKHSKHEAVDSALGYYHQAMYALIVLLDAGDDDGVAIESRDDIEVVGPVPRLMQLKHSIGTPPALTEKNDGLWKTLSIWIPQLGSGDLRFFLVTCAEIMASSPLLQLSDPNSDRSAALAALEGEAVRVVKAVADHKAALTRSSSKQAPPYPERVEACKAFLALTATQRLELLKSITILHRSFNVTSIETQVELRLLSFTRELRPLLARRLVEWWDPRVARSLCGLESRTILKVELLTRVQHLVLELADDNLPDDFGLVTPSSLAGELGSTMEQQIELVDGGAQRLMRAAVARWRARSQRARWMNERVEIGAELTRFDDRLIEHWQDRHGPLQHDCLNESEVVQKTRGRQLLDWSHHDASREVQQPRPKWTAAFLTQGSYQQLAEEQRVGWHPRYSSLLAAKGASSNEVASQVTAVKSRPARSRAGRGRKRK